MVGNERPEKEQLRRWVIIQSAMVKATYDHGSVEDFDREINQLLIYIKEYQDG